MKVSNLPSFYTSSRLFGTGALVGPLVDGLHNQCLLEYHKAPITLAWNEDPIFCTSLWVPPLLGIAYVVLGGVLPRFLSRNVPTRVNDRFLTTQSPNQILTLPERTILLRNKALWAVFTTALIIKLSEILETQSFFATDRNVILLLGCAVLQWACLDGTLVAFLLASITSIGGPQSELPFVAADVWQYLAPDQFPLLSFQFLPDDLQQLGLNRITGPCYFAVTMDAIALGRWYDALRENETNH
ncbi:hypothetical protein FisN_26Hh161 [Fistulifera solaris]|jgi:hypothetical protein|uniref:Uncharacterized protein n=1 Tax=Fistulifera solaris TaxID=1519565 RepID=A0A1Z5JY77_FISSO|nr:hypothetical protein FisN_26Hh161 [Fistulifera solaris]|eukprot:GAX18859.1 hypothetical protein FisN_26Hh161 [Fistulifera solaris]